VANKQQFANYEDKKLRIHPKGEVIRFGVIGDTHLCSKYQQLTFLKWFYEFVAKHKGEFVLHAGDIVDGEHVYRGQQYETFLQGFDDQLGYTVENYPNGLPTYAITGNHCLSHFVRGGGDIGKAIAQQRPDFHYLGQLGAYVYINDLKVYIAHGMGSPAYALSYKVQKMIEAFSSENKPNMLIVGHWHSAFQAFIRNVFAMTPASFQGQTPFLRRMAIFPVVGGYFVEIVPDRKGIHRFKYEFLPLYKPRSHDY